ncbi:MAG: flagellar motor protein MotB [Planctomycetota bacterium]|nr:flagellar motor protein MotB [Planctomycetota bacterium]
MAMKKRSKPEEPGVPEWMVTFGDMMSLLLCFFILLQMFSELKKEHEYQRVITAIKDAFGFSGGVGVLPTDDIPLKSMIEVLEAMALKTYSETKISQNDMRGMDGPNMRVKSVRDGISFVIGGPSTFDEYSAEVKPSVRLELEKLATILRGRRNKIEIIGHAQAKYLGPDVPWNSLDELSFARAMNVKDVLVEMGLDDGVFRLQAVGDREPAIPRAIDPSDAAENRRVEIILTEQLVEEMNTDVNFTNPSLAQGG